MDAAGGGRTIHTTASHTTVARTSAAATSRTPRTRTRTAPAFLGPGTEESSGIGRASTE